MTPTKTRGVRAALAIAEAGFLFGMLAGDLLLLLGSVAMCALLSQLTVTLERTSSGVQ